MAKIEVFKCDKCKKEFREDEVENKVSLRKSLINIKLEVNAGPYSNSNFRNRTVAMHLCESCAKDLGIHLSDYIIPRTEDKNPDYLSERNKLFDLLQDMIRETVEGCL